MDKIRDTLPGNADGTTWKNRIVGEGTEQPDQLLANPNNWRVHPKFQQQALTAVLEKVGWVQRIVVNKRTSFIVDGHLRVTLALRHGEKEIPVSYVDLDEDEESLVLATLDPIAGLAVADDAKLRELMDGIQSDDAAIQAMIAKIAEDEGIIPKDAPDEFPEYGDDIETEFKCPKCGYEWSGSPE